MKTRRRNGFKKRTAKMSMKGGGTRHFNKWVDGEEGIYEGELNDKGERHGKGIMHYTDDDIVCEGDWKNNKMDGNGKLTYGEKSGYKGVSYEGEFNNDEFHGYGIYIDRNNNQFTYRGEFANGKRNGMGFITTTTAMGHGTICGIFENDVFVKGTGKRFLKNLKEEGDFENDKLVKGKKYGSDHLIEEGDFENGEIINGKTTFPCGSVYVGTYNKQGQQDGVGTHVGATYKYRGEYQNGKRSGIGVITYSNGSVYEGQFKDDKRDGMGKLTLPDGTTKIGRFHDNQPSPDVVVLSAASHAARAVSAAQNSIFTELGPAGRVFSRTHRRGPSTK